VIVRSAGLFRATPDQTELTRAARLLGARGPRATHAFEPHGDSVAVLGDRCRVVLHTWPEHALVTVDVYADRPASLAPLVQVLGWQTVDEPGSAEHVRSPGDVA